MLKKKKERKEKQGGNEKRQKEKQGCKGRSKVKWGLLKLFCNMFK